LKRATTLGVVFCALIFAAPARAATSEEVVERMIEAHGGMERWASAPTVTFVDEFRAGGAKSGEKSRVTVEQGRRRMYMDGPGSGASMAWDGKKAWSEHWDAPTPPRFLALLNYYFLNLPWLVADPGVRLGTPGTGTIPGDDTEYVTIKVTYEPGVGDTPDDWYVLYIAPESHRLKGCEYIVTYESLLPEGVESTPPHMLVYDEMATVNGLLVPTRYTIFEGSAVYAVCVISDWSFEERFDEDRMTVPEGAVIDTSKP